MFLKTTYSSAKSETFLLFDLFTFKVKVPNLRNYLFVTYMRIKVAFFAQWAWGVQTPSCVPLRNTQAMAQLGGNASSRDCTCIKLGHYTGF